MEQKNGKMYEKELKTTVIKDWPGKSNRSSRNSNEAIVGIASDAFARWCNHRQDPIELPSSGIISFCHATSCQCSVVNAESSSLLVFRADVC